MADSDNESDFASAESDNEEADLSKETVDEPPKQPSSSAQVEEKGTEVDEGEVSESTPREERPSAVEQTSGGESEEVSTASRSEPVEETKKAESTPTSEDSKDTGDSGVKAEPSPVAPASTEATTEASGTSGDAGGWGWGGWGRSLWSSVSTVTESAQALGQKVTSAIASVEDALGLPSPEDLAEEKDVNTEEVSKQADEMVEHDIPAEEREPVLEEPHKMREEKEEKGKEEEEGEEGGSGGDSKMGEDQLSQQSETAAAGTDSQPSYAGVSTFFSGIASMVQTTGKDFVSGGLDALENLGKKTMEVLTEGDPGLREKRSMIGGGKTPTLSELLQEAKADSEGQGRSGETSGAGGEHTPLTYSRLFDEYKGVVHLEALDLLSKECESKVRSGYTGFTGEKLRSLREKMEELTQAFQVEEEPEVLDDDSSQLPEVIELFSDITLPIKVDRLMQVSDSWRQKAVAAVTSEPATKESQVTGGSQQEKEGEGEEAAAGEEEGAVAAPPGEGGDTDKAKRATCEVLYENGLRSLAELTSASIELFRKMAEISLLPDAQKNPPLIQAQKFNRLTVVVSKELDCLASVHSEAITELDLPDTNSLVTSLYLEASNSGSYVQDAFQLLLPVLKDMLIQQWLAEEPSANVLTRN